jgi:hypothetical protein
MDSELIRRESARLIEAQDINVGEGFDGVNLLYQDPASGKAHGTDDVCKGHGEDEAIRDETGNHGRASDLREIRDIRDIRRCAIEERPEGDNEDKHTHQHIDFALEWRLRLPE